MLGTMEVQYAPNFYMRSKYYGADEFFEITGDEGQLWVTRATGEMLDLAPVMLFTGTAHEIKTTEFTDIDADWGAGFVRSSQHFVDSLLHGTAAAMTAAEATDVLRLCFAVYEAGATRHAGRSPRHHRDREPARLGGVVASRSLPGRPPHLDPVERGPDVAEAAVVRRPLPPGLGELLAAAPDEVPPHEDGLGERARRRAAGPAPAPPPRSRHSSRPSPR